MLTSDSAENCRSLEGLSFYVTGTFFMLYKCQVSIPSCVMLDQCMPLFAHKTTMASISRKYFLLNAAALDSGAEDLNPFKSPFPDSARSQSSSKSLFTKNRAVSEVPQALEKRRSSSLRGFKKTSGSLCDIKNFNKIDAYKAYLEEDEEFYFVKREEKNLESETLCRINRTHSIMKRFSLFN